MLHLGRTLNYFPLLAACAGVSSTIEATNARGRPSVWRGSITSQVIILFDFYPKLYAIICTHIHMYTCIHIHATYIHIYIYGSYATWADNVHHKNHRQTEPLPGTKSILACGWSENSVTRSKQYVLSINPHGCPSEVEGQPLLLKALRTQDSGDVRIFFIYSCLRYCFVLRQDLIT